MWWKGVHTNEIKIKMGNSGMSLEAALLKDENWKSEWDLGGLAVGDQNTWGVC